MRTYVKKENYLKQDDYLTISRKKYFETVFLDDKLFNRAVEFYNQYFGYLEHPLKPEEAMWYAELGVRINADLWKSLMPMDEVKMDFFYSITPFYFFHDIVRFMDGMHRGIVQDLNEENIKTVLDFAGGTGGFTIFLSQNGKKVDYYDSNNLQRAWMKWLKEKEGYSYNVIESARDITERYDLVIAKDIAEHVIDPVGFRNWICSKIVDKGKLYMTQIPCCGPDEMAPMHFKVDMEGEDVKADVEENKRVLARAR